LVGSRYYRLANDCNTWRPDGRLSIDELVASAIAHWKPRFTANGVIPSEFERITAGLERWDDWCGSWTTVAAEHEALGRESLSSGRDRSAGSHLARAAVYYHFAKFVFVHDIPQMRSAHARAVTCLNDALPHLHPPGERHEIEFEGGSIVGVLRRPGQGRRWPAVVLVPGLDSAKEEFRATERLFLERGLATFSVDGPGQGEAEYDQPIRGDWEVPGAAIIDHLQACRDIDGGRIGVWGVSLGGYYAPRIAGGEARVRACIALAGPYDFGAIWDGLPGLSRLAFRVRSGKETDDAAREHAHSLSLEGRARSITCPVLVVMGKLDRIVPWEQAQRLVDEVAGEVEFLLLEDGNHGCANVPHKHRYHSADWMAENLRN
jgi:dipeptidyl aminopeptidase/acylaminoacyl peptidase